MEAIIITGPSLPMSVVVGTLLDDNADDDDNAGDVAFLSEGSIVAIADVVAVAEERSRNG
jgi:hypothetical protein